MKSLVRNLTLVLVGLFTIATPAASATEQPQANVLMNFSVKQKVGNPFGAGAKYISTTSSYNEDGTSLTSCTQCGRISVIRNRRGANIATVQLNKGQRIVGQSFSLVNKSGKESYRSQELWRRIPLRAHMLFFYDAPRYREFLSQELRVSYISVQVYDPAQPTAPTIGLKPGPLPCGDVAACGK